MPTPQGNEKPYRVPTSTSTQLVYRGLPLDQIEDLIVHSSAWKQAEALLLPTGEMAGGRPITPLHAGHVGLLCTAGLLNGVFGQGDRSDVDGELSYSTASSYLSVIKQVRLKWGETRISRMKPLGVQEWLKKMDAAPKTKGHVKALMHRLYEKAMLWEIVEWQRNPARPERNRSVPFVLRLLFWG